MTEWTLRTLSAMAVAGVVAFVLIAASLCACLPEPHGASPAIQGPSARVGTGTDAGPGGRPGKSKPPVVLNPNFNVREILKQMILLGEHLTDPSGEKVCYDCILKHLLSIEGYAEEAQTLVTGDCKLKHEVDLPGIIAKARAWISRAKEAHDRGDGAGCTLEYRAVAQEVRKERKKLLKFADHRVCE